MQLVEHPFVSESTAKTLAQFGWQDGDAIPAELGAKLLAMKEGIAKASDTTVLVAIADLSEEQINGVKEMLAEAKVVAKKKKEEAEKEERMAKMSPSVAKEYEKLQAATKIVDDREKVAQEETAEQASAPAPDKNTPEPVIGPLAPPLYCPRCGWDVHIPHDVKITDLDKEDFLVSVLGNKRFYKTYDLFGGRMVVRFRSVTADENAQIYRQIALDQQNGVIETRGEWVVKLLDYRMACALAQVTDRDGKILHAFPELPGAPTGKDQTNILSQYDLLAQTVLAQEATRRLLCLHLRDFCRLTEALEAMALDSNFWKGID